MNYPKFIVSNQKEESISIHRINGILSFSAFVCCHRCDNGECVPHSSVCDGKLDCNDGSDEEDCPTHYSPSTSVSVPTTIRNITVSSTFMYSQPSTSSMVSTEHTPTPPTLMSTTKPTTSGTQTESTQTSSAQKSNTQSSIPVSTVTVSTPPPGTATTSTQTTPSVTSTQTTPSVTSTQTTPSVTSTQTTPSVTSTQTTPSVTSTQTTPSVTSTLTPVTTGAPSTLPPSTSATETTSPASTSYTTPTPITPPCSTVDGMANPRIVPAENIIILHMGGITDDYKDNLRYNSI